MRCYFLFTFLFLSSLLFGQYQGIPMTGSNIKPNQIRWTRDIGTDSIFVMCSDTTTGKPFWFACKKSTLLSGSSGNTDGQQLSLLSGGGTLKLTQLTGASNFVQLRDSSITNEGKLTLTPPSGGIAYINSNTSTSASVGINQGAGITLSNGGTNIVTITNSSLNTDGQTLSLLSGGGTLKLTQLTGASNFVQLRDSSITNEGELSVLSGTASTSVITSNTSGSSAVTLKAGSGITLSEAVDTITITSTASSSVKEAKKSDRLGIIVVSDSVGFDYKKLVYDTSPDTLMFIPVFDSTTNRNKKVSIKEFYYDPFAETLGDDDFTLSLVNGVDSVVRFYDGFAYLWSYTKSTGKLKYNGTRSLYFKIDAGVQFKYANTSPQPDETIFKIRRNDSEVKRSVIGNLAKVTGSNVPGIITVDASRILYIYPGDEIDITLQPDTTRSATIKSGYLNIIAISRQSAF